MPQIMPLKWFLFLLIVNMVVMMFMVFYTPTLLLSSKTSTLPHSSLSFDNSLNFLLKW